jgi:hypothetical protein
MIKVTKKRRTAAPPIAEPAIPPGESVAGAGVAGDGVGEEEGEGVDDAEELGDAVEEEDGEGVPVLDTALETPLG